MERAVARPLPRVELALAGAELEQHLQLLVVHDLRLVATEEAPVVLAELGVLLAAIVAIVAPAAVPFDPGHRLSPITSNDSRTECPLPDREEDRLPGSGRRRPSRREQPRRPRPRDGCRRTARSRPSRGPCSSSCRPGPPSGPA